MHDDNHRLLIVGLELLELLLAEIRGAPKQSCILPLVLIHNEVDGKGADEGLVVGLEDLALVVNLWAHGFGGRPEGLHVPIEQQRVQDAWRCGLFDDLEKIGLGPLLVSYYARLLRVGEAGLCVTQPLHCDQLKEAE